jgi:Domain of unknown function (DUF4160)
LTLDQQVSAAIQRAADLDELAHVLQRLLSGGYSVWTDGTLYNIRARVATVDGLRFEVYPNDHSPPHFHVRSADVSAAFQLSDGSLIAGTIDSRSRQLVNWFLDHGGTQKLRDAWDATRPTQSASRAKGA